MASTAAQTKRRGSALLIPASTLDATQAQLASDAWARFAPSPARDLLNAIPLVGEFTTFTLSIVGASRTVKLSPFVIGESIDLKWDGNGWSAFNVSLNKKLSVTLKSDDAVWRGVSGERGGDVTLRTSKQDGVIVVSLSRQTLIPAFAIVGLAVYRWDADNLKYQGVTPQSVKQAVNTFVQNAGVELVALTQQMNAGSISIGEWQTRFAEHAQAVHTAADVAAQGGWSQLKTTDVDRINRVREDQVDRLRQFSLDVEDERVTEKQAESRAKLYDRSATSLTYEGSVGADWAELEAASGIAIEEQNVLGQAEHCRTEDGVVGCLDETDRGWVARGTLSKCGTRVCGPNCVCRIAYRRKPKP